VPADQIDPPPTIMGEASLDIITGVGKIDGKLVAMIEVDRILSVDELNQIAVSVEAAKDETALRST
jgi:purine-binding chemotaxis protein CheW